MLREGTAYHLLILGARDGVRLGSVGLEVHERPAPHGELGYWLAAPARGRGIATRAVTLLARWGTERRALPSIEIHAMPANGRSRAVAQRAGFELAERRLLPFRGRIEDFDVFVLKTTGAAASGRPGA